MLRLSGLSAVALAVGLLSICSPAFADLQYSQNFNLVGQAALVTPGAGNTVDITTVLPGWALKANNASTPPNLLTVANGVTGGYVVGGYLATGDGSDFNLSIYNTGAGSVNFITYTYTAPTIETGIVGSFDYESAWSRFLSSTSRTAGFENGLSYSINGGSAVGVSSTAFHVNNASVPVATTWLTDAQMDAAGLSLRNITFGLPGVTLNAGDTITFKWDQSIYAGDKNMAEGIDNFKLGDNNSLAEAAVPEPSSILLLATMLLGVGITCRRSFARG